MFINPCIYASRQREMRYNFYGEDGLGGNSAQAGFVAGDEVRSSIIPGTTLPTIININRMLNVGCMSLVSGPNFRVDLNEPSMSFYCMYT